MVHLYLFLSSQYWLLVFLTIRWEWLIPVILGSLLLAAGIAYVLVRLPVIAGYAAKHMCSDVFVSGRRPADIKREDLGFFPLFFAGSEVDYEERTVRSTVLGMASRKAVFREGLGVTLVTNTTEEALREQASAFKPPSVKPERPEAIPWPMGDLLPGTIPEGVNKEKLDGAIDRAFADPKLRTRAVVVLYRGQLIGEAYAPGFDASTPQLGWSLTKSVTATLVGILVRQGRLKLDQPVGFSMWQGDARRQITLDDLMRMSSGLAWNEAYGNLTDVVRMLYLVPDMASFAIRKPLEADPGSSWVYASGSTNLLSYIIRREMSSLEEYWAFPRRALFNRIGMRSAVIEPDVSGTFVGSSFGYATPRDWARFGLLYLNDGVWQGERLLPEGWVSYTREQAPASAGEYGAQFWLNRDKALPDVPEDTYACQGFQEQRIFIIPSRDLVIVRMGLTEAGAFDFNRFLVDIMTAIPEN